MFFIVLIILTMIAVYFGFCVESNEYTFTGRIKLLVALLNDKFLSILPPGLTQYLKALSNYIFNQLNPIVQIVYLFLVLGLFIIYVLYGVNEHLPSENIQIEYAYIGYGLCALSVYFFIRACLTDPGIIKSRNHQAMMKKYPCDMILYEPGECGPCKFSRVPRSKHCSICDKCVEKFDHHCIWINQCVGAKNYKYFLLFISSHAVLCTYLSILGVIILYDYILRNKLFEAKFINKKTNELVETSYLTVFKYVIFKNYAFFSAVVMLVTVAITLTLFSYYHLYLISLGVTTNEKSKRGKLAKFMRLIIETLKGLSKSKGYDITKMQKDKLSDEDIIRFKNIAFKNPEFDLVNLPEEDVYKFYKFAELSIVMYKRNVYNKGLIQNLKEIFM